MDTKIQTGHQEMPEHGKTPTQEKLLRHQKILPINGTHSSHHQYNDQEAIYNYTKEI
jgi:hypothetical protein